MAKQQEKVGIDIKLVTMITSHQDCTTDFFEEGVLPEKYRIIKISKNKYGLADLESKECEICFKKISKINNRYYLLDLENGNKALLMFWNDERKFISDTFKEVIQGFREAVLIEDLAGERKLIGWKDEVYSCPKYYSSTWIGSEGANNASLFLPNCGEVILLKEGLTVVDKIFKRVLGYVSDIEINNKFRIVKFEDESMAVIRIDDLEESPHFKSINYISHGARVYSEKYVEVTLDDDKKAILRINDFELSKGYKEICYLTFVYALIKDGDTFNVLRLSDFAEAKWPEDQES